MWQAPAAAHRIDAVAQADQDAGPAAQVWSGRANRDQVQVCWPSGANPSSECIVDYVALVAAAQHKARRPHLHIILEFWGSGSGIYRDVWIAEGNSSYPRSRCLVSTQDIDAERVVIAADVSVRNASRETRTMLRGNLRAGCERIRGRRLGSFLSGSYNASLVAGPGHPPSPHQSATYCRGSSIGGTMFWLRRKRLVGS
jgi:hypothetical protein